MTGANARTCAGTRVLVHAKPREAITSLLPGLGLHGVLHLGGGGGKRGEQRQGSPSTPQQLLYYPGSHLAWRESTEPVEIIFPRGEDSSQAQRAPASGSKASGSNGHSALGNRTGQTGARLRGPDPTSKAAPPFPQAPASCWSRRHHPGPGHAFTLLGMRCACAPQGSC